MMSTTCPKCSNKMTKGEIPSTGLNSVLKLKKYGDVRGDDIIAFYCENCGFIELYTSKFFKER